MKFFLSTFFILFSNVCLADSSNLIGSWVIVDGYCDDGSELSSAVKSDIANNIENQTTRTFDNNATT